MRKWILLYFFMYAVQIFGEENMLSIREMYYNSTNNEDDAISFLKYFEDIDVKNRATLLGYNAVANFVQAKYLWNPVAKYDYFTIGRDLLQKAISMENSNLELRYLRLSIQTNLPSFLDYKSNIEEDKKMLISQFETVEDIDLKTRIKDYLKEINAI